MFMKQYLSNGMKHNDNLLSMLIIFLTDLNKIFFKIFWNSFKHVVWNHICRRCFKPSSNVTICAYAPGLYDMT